MVDQTIFNSIAITFALWWTDFGDDSTFSWKKVAMCGLKVFIDYFLMLVYRKLLLRIVVPLHVLRILETLKEI